MLFSQLRRLAQGQLHASNIISNQLLSLRAVASTTAPTTLNDIFAGCILERYPIIVPDEPEWETRFRQWQHKWHENHWKHLPKEEIEEKEDASELLHKWTPAPRIDPVHEANPKSLRRQMDKRIFMLIKDKSTSTWSFPFAQPKEGETMRACAERALSQVIDPAAVELHILGNAPAGHLDDSSSGMNGGQEGNKENSSTKKRFLHRMQLLNGEPKLLPQGSAVDYAWAAKHELKEYITDKKMLNLLEKML